MIPEITTRYCDNSDSWIVEFKVYCPSGKEATRREYVEWALEALLFMFPESVVEAREAS